MPFYPANKVSVPFNRTISEKTNGDRNVKYAHSLNSDIGSDL